MVKFMNCCLRKGTTVKVYKDNEDFIVREFASPSSYIEGKEEIYSFVPLLRDYERMTVKELRRVLGIKTKAQIEVE